MDKTVVFGTRDNLGRFFAEAIDVTPRGGGLEKIAGALHPELALFIKGLRPDPRFQYVLMTPMGAFEFYGMNVNGDVFPEISLKHDHSKDDPGIVAKALEEKWLKPFGKSLPPGNYSEFGHKTFLNALRYRHHINKQPEISYGDICCAVWNPAMHRVEVIVRHDREKAKRVGAEEIILDIDAGRPRMISMGCKVPFDVGTCCGHISRNQADYCEHLRTQMGSIMPDGRIVGAVNFFPRFFDLSDVLIPAAKESGVLMKVAQVRGEPIKTSAQNKAADIKKEVLPNAGYDVVRELSSREPDLSPELLRRSDLGGLLTTLAALGIVMKPSEFQYSMLHRMGEGEMAEEMRGGCQLFCPVHGPVEPASFDGDSYSPGLARALAPVLGERSGFYPHLPRRVIRITVIRARPAQGMKEAPQSEKLSKVAAAYAAYRAALRGIPKLAAVAVARDPAYYEKHFLGDLLVDSMSKTASAHGATLSTPLVPLYVYNAHRPAVVSVPESWNFSSPPGSPVRALLGPVL